MFWKEVILTLVPQFFPLFVPTKKHTGAFSRKTCVESSSSSSFSLQDNTQQQSTSSVAATQAGALQRTVIISSQFDRVDESDRKSNAGDEFACRYV
jgi:hypothetical protein